MTDNNAHRSTGTAAVLPIRFTGTGRDYARLWLGNLAMVALTLGVLLPMARARRLRYWREHTLVGGEPLAFDGDGREQMRPHLLMLGALAVYTLIAHSAPLVAAILLLALAPAWPWRMRDALRWRINHTRWRGQPLRFEGTPADAREVFRPAVVPLAVLLIGQALLAQPDPPGGWLLAVVVSLALLALLGLVPWLHERRSRYLHAHLGLGEESTHLEAIAPRDFYRMHAGLLGLLLGLMLLHLLCAPLIAAAEAIAPLLTGLLVDIGLLLTARAYWVARTQDLLWNRMRSQHLSFSSALPVHRLVLLYLKNMLLCTVTLGLYWPFAAVAVARLRLEAVQVRIART